MIELVWLVLGVIWSAQHYQSCDAQTAKKTVLGECAHIQQAQVATVCLNCVGRVNPLKPINYNALQRSVPASYSIVTFTTTTNNNK